MDLCAAIDGERMNVSQWFIDYIYLEKNDGFVIVNDMISLYVAYEGKWMKVGEKKYGLPLTQTASSLYDMKSAIERK
jgi:hypothetical protein